MERHTTRKARTATEPDHSTFDCTQPAVTLMAVEQVCVYVCCMYQAEMAHVLWTFVTRHTTAYLLNGCQRATLHSRRTDRSGPGEGRGGGSDDLQGRTDARPPRILGSGRSRPRCRAAHLLLAVDVRSRAAVLAFPGRPAARSFEAPQRWEQASGFPAGLLAMAARRPCRSSPRGAWWLAALGVGAKHAFPWATERDVQDKRSALRGHLPASSQPRWAGPGRF
ncbi:hypothetical protein T440DRAFT_96197 [Plenodomus tracheiphilus IPT5]|uniref:Uncharacterized protein n=1 Tax=Plenodomus tracheiphilus IPT5 TaxID=1408161 RepID=A0A6A7BLG1_9PLEO|nr:hypothetical protein T440DRAFT_96197 [Plenodomus tracheiphilus IPT5]